MNETPAQTPARSEVTAWPVRGSSRIAILTQGWGTGLARGALAFVAMAALGQVVAFAANLARSPGESAATAAKLGWLYFGWFHHAAVTTRVTSVEGVRVGGEAGLTANVGLAMMLGTFLAIAILYKGGRAVADGARGGAMCPSPPRDEGGARVRDPSHSWCHGLVSIDIPIPRNGLVAGSLQMPSWGLSWFVLPLLIAAAAGAAGGLRSGRHELISHDPWGRRASGVMAGGLRMFVLGLVLSFAGLLVLAAIRPGATTTYFETVSGPPTDQTTMNIAHHVLLLPNQSMWVLVPAMGGCDGLSGGGVSATFLCYSKVPTTVSVTPEGLNSDTPAVQADFAKAPSGSLLFLLVPAVSVVLGGRYAARKRARTQVGGHRLGSRVRRRLRGPGGVGLVAGLDIGGALLAHGGYPRERLGPDRTRRGGRRAPGARVGGRRRCTRGMARGQGVPSQGDTPLRALEPPHPVGRGCSPTGIGSRLGRGWPRPRDPRRPRARARCDRVWVWWSLIRSPSCAPA